MTTIIFKNEKKAKVYEVRAAKDFGCYRKGELIKKIKTDEIQSCNQNYFPGEITFTEVKA